MTREKLALLQVTTPPLHEQRQIVTILDTIDDAIRRTEQIVGKLKQATQGLLQHLFTRGIDDNGDLRDPESHPNQFKASQLAQIPREWEVRTLRDVIHGGLSNGVFKEPSRVGTGQPLVNVGDLYAEFGIDVRRVERFSTLPAEALRFAVAPGDIFFTRSSLNLAGIAWCNIVRDVPEPTVFECHLMRARPNLSAVVPAFLGVWCRSPFARNFVMARAKQVTMTTISQPDLHPLPVPVPTLSEQHRIVNTVDAAAARLASEARYVEKLRAERIALMEDLLTGRVRVPVSRADK